MLTFASAPDRKYESREVRSCFPLFLSEMGYFVYILQSLKNDKYYIGQTNDVGERLKRHNSGMVASTAPHGPWKLVWYTEKPDRADAMMLELKIKNLSRERIERFIQKYSDERPVADEA